MSRCRHQPVELVVEPGEQQVVAVELVLGDLLGRALQLPVYG